MKEQVFVDLVLKETGFKMEYLPKVQRAIYGIDTADGKKGGVGEDADAKTILAKYDELGGYITQKGYKVKGGAFYDRKRKKILDKPDIVLLIKVNGEVVEYREGDRASLELLLAMKQTQEKLPQEKVEEKVEEINV